MRHLGRTSHLAMWRLHLWLAAASLVKDILAFWRKYGGHRLRCPWKWGGSICPTLTGDHENRITDYTAIVVSKGSDAMDNERKYIVRRLTPLE